MPETNPEIAKLFPQDNRSACISQLQDCQRKLMFQQSRFRGVSLRAMAVVAVLFCLSAKVVLLPTSVAAQTKNSDLSGQANGTAVAQVPGIDLQSPVLVSVQAAVDDLRKQTSTSSAANSSNHASAVPESMKSVGLFQSGNCVDPHPGNPQQSQQQVDGCHAQVWYKWSDGCTGYRMVPSQSPGGGANCGNSQPASDRITWTFCAAKHTS